MTTITDIIVDYSSRRRNTWNRYFSRKGVTRNEFD